jgi:hypothetical protein
VGYYYDDTAVNTEFTLFWLKRYRSKPIMNILAILSLFLIAANSSFAAPVQQFSYRTQISQDLDGDQKPETATVRQAGELYQVSVHFSTGRPKIHLTTHLRQGLAGLSFQATDVNNDSRRDLVVTSATSFKPLAIWLNQGPAKFKKVHSAFFGALGRYTGPAYRHQTKTEPEPAGNITADPLPEAAQASGYLTIHDEAVAIVASYQDQRPFDSLLEQEPPRGPPAPARA